jgi:hypothetical protein
MIPRGLCILVTLKTPVKSLECVTALAEPRDRLKYGFMWFLQVVPITFKVGSTSTGYLKLSIGCTLLGPADEDGMTEVSGMTGLTSAMGSVDQDLSGEMHGELLGNYSRLNCILR